MGYIAESTLDLRHISQIFQKDNRGIFTNDARLAQDILRYYFEVKAIDIKFFKLRPLKRWLVQHNKEIRTYYSDKDSSKHTNIGNRIHGFERRINRVFKGQMQLHLIKAESLVPADKLKDKQVELYAFTKPGGVLALIINSMDLGNELDKAKQKKNASTMIQTKTKELNQNYADLCELIISMLATGESAPYQTTLLKTFLIKLQSKELFAKFVDCLILVCNTNDRIDGIPYLVNHALHDILSVSVNNDLFLDLWYESINEIDPAGKKILLYEIKLSIEQRFRNNINGYSKEFENQCFTRSADYNKLVLEGECIRCKKFSVILLSHDSYRDWIKNSKMLESNKQKFDCIHCQSKDACIIPTF